MGYNKDPRKRGRENRQEKPGAKVKPKQASRPAGKRTSPGPPPPPVGKSASPPPRPLGKSRSKADSKGAGKGCCLGAVIMMIILGAVAVILGLFVKQKAEVRALEHQERVRAEYQAHMAEQSKAVAAASDDAGEVVDSVPMPTEEPAAPVLNEVDPLSGEILKMKSNDPATVRKAIQLLRRQTDSGEAHHALKTAALSHADPDIRYQAIHALASFKEVDHRDVCRKVVSGGDARLAKSALNLAASTQFYGYGDVLLLALDHADSSVREWSLRTIGSHRLKAPKYEDKLTRLIQNDPDEKVRLAAVSALSRWQSPKVLPALRTMISTDQKQSARSQAFNLLTQWQADPQALSILEGFREDPQLGRRVQTHLARYGR